MGKLRTACENTDVTQAIPLALLHKDRNTRLSDGAPSVFVPESECTSLGNDCKDRSSSSLLTHPGQHHLTKLKQKMSTSLGADNLFRVDGIVAAITGGGTGKLFHVELCVLHPKATPSNH
jgi:hypothetical protein